MQAAAAGAPGAAAAAQWAPVKRSFLPPFADERNREVDRQIRELEAQLEQAHADIEENGEHVKVLSEHLGNVRLEIKHTQGHLTAKRQEVETEGHLRELSRREVGRLQSDTARLARQRAELEERAAGMRTEVFAAQERLDQFRLLMNWNQEELEQWSTTSRQKEEDALALERYRRQDEARVKELTMALERVAREEQAARRALEDEITETQAVQGALGKAADDFRQLHAERHELLAQWEGVLAAVARRDGEILTAGEALPGCKAEMARLRAELAAASVALEGEAAASAALSKQIAAQERGIKHQYNAFAAEQAAQADAEDQLDLLTNSTAGAADEASTVAAANGHLRAEVARRAVAVEMAQQHLAATQERVEAAASQLGTILARLAELERLRQEEQAKADSLDRQLAALAKQQFRAGQELHAAREEQRRLEGESGGARAQRRNLSHQLARLEERMVRQQEVLYNVDFQLVQMERKVARAAGERTRDETAALTARIDALTKALEAVKAEHSMLVEQVTCAENDHARAQRAHQAANKDRAAVVDAMGRLEVESDATARAVKAATKEKEERLVEADVWKLEMRQLRGLLTSKSSEVLGLEHRKRCLELGLAERRSEVGMQMELMQGEARLLREDLSRVTKELNERQLAVEKLRCKYETLVLKGRGQEGEGEGLQSQAYYIVKAAQERQELAEQAEGLVAAVAQAERESRALEATLQRLAGCNQEMNLHYRFAAKEELAEQQAATKAALQAAVEALAAQRGEEAARRAELEEARGRLDNLAAEEEHMRRLLAELQAQRAEVERQLDEQRERLARAAQRVDRLRRQLHARAGGGRGPGAAASTRPPTAAGAGQSAGRPGTGAATTGARPATAGTGGGALALPAGAASLADVEADVALALLREGIKGLVEALRAVDAEHADLKVLHRVEAGAGFRLAAEGSGAPGSAGRAGSRPASAVRSASGSVRGSPSRPASSAGASVARSGGATPKPASPAVCMMQLRL